MERGKMKNETKDTDWRALLPPRTQGEPPRCAPIIPIVPVLLDLSPLGTRFFFPAAMITEKGGEEAEGEARSQGKSIQGTLQILHNITALVMPETPVFMGLCSILLRNYGFWGITYIYTIFKTFYMRTFKKVSIP